MRHDVTDVAGELARRLHDLRNLAIDGVDAEVRRRAIGRTVLGLALSTVEVSERLSNRRAQVSKIEVPLAGHIAALEVGRDAVRRRPTEDRRFSIADLARADLDRVDPHLAALVLVAVGEQECGRLEGATGIVETLVRGPIILLDAVDVLGDHRRVRRHVVRGHHAVPLTGRERAAAIVTAAALAEVVALPEQVTVVRVVQRAGLQQRRCAGPGGVHEDVHDQRVLVDARAATVRGDAVRHDVTDLTRHVAGHFQDLGHPATDVGNAEGLGRAELALGLGGPTDATEVLERRARRRAQVTEVEVPLTGEPAAGTTGNHDVKTPGRRTQARRGIRVFQTNRIADRRPGCIRVERDGRLAVRLRQRLRRDRVSIEPELHPGGGNRRCTVRDQRRDRRRRAVAGRSGRGRDGRHVGPVGLNRRAVPEHPQGGRIVRIVQQDARDAVRAGEPLEAGSATGLPIDEPERIQAGARRRHGPHVLVLRIGLERRSKPLELADLQVENVPGIRTDRHDVGIVVVHVRTIRAHDHAERGRTRRQFDETNNLDCEGIGSAAISRNARERIGGEARHEIPELVLDVESRGVALEVDRVDEVSAADLRPNDGVVGDHNAVGVLQRAVDLAQGADEVVADDGFGGRLEGAHDEPAIAGGARVQRESRRQGRGTCDG